MHMCIGLQHLVIILTEHSKSEVGLDSLWLSENRVCVIDVQCVYV